MPKDNQKPKDVSAIEAVVAVLDDVQKAKEACERAKANPSGVAKFTPAGSQQIIVKEMGADSSMHSTQG